MSVSGVISGEFSLASRPEEADEQILPRYLPS
jgi:hypothetical protein